VEEDRRRYPRFDVRYPVKIVTSRGMFEGETKDMSAGGTFIWCQETLRAQEMCGLKIEIPTGSPLQLSARVIWSRAPDPDDETSPRGMGVRFVW